jgi:NUMOD3 motif
MEALDELLPPGVTRSYTLHIVQEKRNGNKNPHGYSASITQVTKDLGALGRTATITSKVVWNSGIKRLRAEVSALGDYALADYKLAELKRRMSPAALAAQRALVVPRGRGSAGAFSMLGRKHTEETKAKISARLKAAWARNPRPLPPGMVGHGTFPPGYKPTVKEMQKALLERQREEGKAPQGLTALKPQRQSGSGRPALSKANPLEYAKKYLKGEPK